MNKIAAIVKLLRVKQWTKNVFVFAALIFTKGFTEPHRVQITLLAFFAMCLASSATYIVNDIFDLERDRAHPKKSKRPLASGVLSVPFAIALAIACLAGSVALALYVRPEVLTLVGVYLALQVFYNLGLKHIPIADVFVVASGFVLRAIVGAVALQVTISGWLLLCTGALALLLGFGKRRSEVISQGDSRGSSRESLEGYTKPVLDALVIMVACAAALCYGIYCIESPTAKQYPALLLTSPWVFYAVARYVMLIFGKDEGGEPDSLVFRDPHMVICFVLYLITAMLALTGPRLNFLG